MRQWVAEGCPGPTWLPTTASAPQTDTESPLFELYQRYTSGCPSSWTPAQLSSAGLVDWSPLQQL